MYEREFEEMQRKLLTTTAERDTIKAAFQALISVLKLPEDTDPLSFSLTDINVGLQASTSERTMTLSRSCQKPRVWIVERRPGLNKPMAIR
ncbi:hypothetical protein PISMIDRAFT_18870 [Pisolithus microcarpus 441]|uniref:Uncharacterized protein n=1 Tax=Pisolithus microcarpus 441 TaxID=765257 RepID=A0A0C9YPG6_9AGAM|nr:hypothetical protein PISMIDRAFT_18870 [Pisolithus microcarpus 441]